MSIEVDGFHSNSYQTAMGGQAIMAEPFKKIGGDVLASTVAVCSDKGKWTSDHADWLRRGDNAALVRSFMEQNMRPGEKSIACRPYSAEEGMSKKDIAERAEGPYKVYPRNWTPTAPTDRLALLWHHFPELDFGHAERLIEQYTKPSLNNPSSCESGGLYLPPQADSGLLIFPKLDAIREKGLCRRGESDSPSNVAMRYMLGVLKRAFPGFRDGSDGKVGASYQYLLPSTRTFLEALDEVTPGDIYVVPIQTGLSFAGYSVNAVEGAAKKTKRHVLMDDFAGACLALTDHPRFTKHSLRMVCAATRCTHTLARASDNVREFYRTQDGDMAYGVEENTYFGNSMRGVATFVLTDEMQSLL